MLQNDEWLHELQKKQCKKCNEKLSNGEEYLSCTCPCHTDTQEGSTK